MTYSTSILIYGYVESRVLWIAFLATYLGYNYQRLISVRSSKKNNPKDEWFLSNINSLKVLGFISLLGCIYLCIIIFSLKETLWFSPFAFIVLCYRWPILGVALRDVPYLKLFFISISWGFITVLLPQFSEHDLDISWMLILINTLYIIGITIPFDIRDLETDSVDKKTIPQVFGVRVAVLVSIVCILLAGIMFFQKGFIGLLYMCIFSVIIVIFSIRKRPDWFFSFVIDGLLLLFPLFTIFKS